MSATVVLADSNVFSEFVKKTPRCTSHALAWPGNPTPATGLVMATRNVRDFIGCSVQVINPFDDF
jgi:hypothetical protein